MPQGKLSLVLFLSAIAAWSQVNGRISGTVMDASGAAIPGAKVEVRIPGGATPVLVSETNEQGLFTFSSVRPATYDIQVSAPGFARYSARQVKVDPISEMSLGQIKLEVAAAEQMVEVTADVQTVQVANSEISTTVTRQQIQDLPALGRQVSTLFATQAGVSAGRGPTVINGLRTSAANVTLDGINIQDNFIRTNSLDFMPIRPTIEQIGDMTIAVGNAGSTIGGGAAQISLSTRSGSNDFHGSLYWYNRNSAFSANEWFNNRAGVEVPFLNLNQPGGALGGRIIRDKLFFFGNYEEYREKQQASELRTVLTPQARQGVFTWARGAQSLNLLQARQLSADPAMAAMLQALPQPNSTDRGDGLNTSGFRFNSRDNGFRRQAVSRMDYYLSSNHSFTGTYNYTKERNDRGDVATQFYTPVPPNLTDTNRHFTSLAWRWTAGPTLTNEVRGGFLLSPTQFIRADATPAAHVSGTLFTNPVNNFMPQGRYTDTYSIQDNANWLKGKHDIAFGFQSQLIRIEPYNDGGIVPTLTLGISPANTSGFIAANLPGATTGDITVANQLYTSLAGIVSSASQAFNVTSATSGFVPGAGEVRKFAYDTYAGYIQDRWKARRGLTLTFGLRYEYWTVLKEQNNLLLLPALQNNNVIQSVLDPLAVHDLVGNGGRQLYRPDRNNWAPNLGFAWDPFGSGKTAIRASYSLSFINDDSVTAIRNNANTNPGLNQTAATPNLVTRVSAFSGIPAPAFQVPRTQADNYRVNSTAALGLPDPGLKTPYIQKWDFNIQQELKGGIFEIRYLGNRGTQLLRAFDYNQVVIGPNGFLDDFIRARNNGFLSESVTGRFDPTYAGPGGQPLTVFPQLGNPLYTNATIQRLLREGQVGDLASTYQTNRLNGAVNFFRNPNALASNVITNGGNSTYHAMQVDYRRRLTSDFNFQANYTYGKVLTDNAGDGQTRFDPFLDLGNRDLEISRAPFDLTHAIKANGSYTLPFGKGRRWSSGSPVLNHIFGGWVVSGLMQWQSGLPFSVLSERGTLNRALRSAGKNTAVTTLTKSQLEDQVFGLQKLGNGVWAVSQGSRGPDGRGVGNDGAAPFNGQAFFHPGPGQVGSLQRRMFSGPWAFGLDMALLKRFPIRGDDYIELRANGYNLPNHPTFDYGDQLISSVNFG
ncbi:MAG: TonB-dependent receptor, partial [Bryobacteraceae bacterium]|nr:TonB-dependent receptor [Bryobacteraceae bacterium]